MKRTLLLAALPVLAVGGWLLAQPSGEDNMIEGFRNVEVASVSDAIEQLYGQKTYMSHDMRPLFKTKFAGPAAFRGTKTTRGDGARLGAQPDAVFVR